MFKINKIISKIINNIINKMAKHLIEYDLEPESKTEINDIKFYISAAFNKYLQGTNFDIIANLKLDKIKDGLNLLSDLLNVDEIIEDNKNDKFIDEIKKKLEKFENQEEKRLKKLYADTKDFKKLDKQFFEININNESNFCYDFVKTEIKIPYQFKLKISKQIKDHQRKNDQHILSKYVVYKNIAIYGTENMGVMSNTSNHIIFNIGSGTINKIQDLTSFFTYEQAETIINKLKEMCNEIRKLEITTQTLKNYY
jgi:hypothetical protein